MSEKTLVIGAAGKIGRQLIPLLAQAGLAPRAMVRRESQRHELESLGAETVLGDLEGDFQTAFEGCNRVVFTAGSGASTGADKTLLVDLWGAVKTIRTAAERGVQHYVMISARNAGDPDRGPEAIRHYLVAKHVADKVLEASGIPYTILRPGRLLDEPGNGRFRTERPTDPREQVIPRQDVAAAVRYCLQHPSATLGRTRQLYSGEHALEALFPERR